MAKIFLLLIFSINLRAQPFSKFISKLPQLEVPVKWSADEYLNWPEIDLPENIFGSSGIDLYSGKALAAVNFRTHYLVLVKEFYSYKNDFFIYGLLYKADGSFQQLINLKNTIEGYHKDFSIGKDLKLRILDSYGTSGKLSNFIVENNDLIEQGTTIFYDDAVAYMEEDDNQ